MGTKETPKHSVGKGAQREHHNDPAESSYEPKPKAKNAEPEGANDDYLAKKWRQIASDFNKLYKLDISPSEFKDNSFSETLKKLESKTGKPRAALKKEIENWK